MKPLAKNSLASILSQTETDHDEAIAPERSSPSLFHKAEIWSGRFAMVGFTTTVMAIAFKFTL